MGREKPTIRISASLKIKQLHLPLDWEDVCVPLLFWYHIGLYNVPRPEKHVLPYTPILQTYCKICIFCISAMV